jgi:hypothetical protein
MLGVISIVGSSGVVDSLTLLNISARYFGRPLRQRREHILERAEIHIVTGNEDLPEHIYLPSKQKAASAVLDQIYAKVLVRNLQTPHLLKHHLS